MKTKKDNSLKHVKEYFKGIQNISISININEINSLAKELFLLRKKKRKTILPRSGWQRWKFFSCCK